MKKLCFILFLLFIFIFPTIKVGAMVNPTNDFYVNDYANILSEETEKYILNKSIDLNNIDGSQIVIVTVNNLEGINIEDYSLKLFNKFGIGAKHKNNGLLILIALEEREFRVVVGYGLELLFTDEKIGDIQDEYMVPYFRNNHWDEGIRHGYDVFYDEIYNKMNISFIDRNRDVIEIILVFINLLFGLILPFIFRFIKNKNLFESDRKINVKCLFIYLLVLFLIVVIEIIININVFILIINTINNVLMFGIVYYKINYKSSDNYYKDIDRYGRYGRTRSSESSGSIGSSSGHRGGGGSSRGSGSSKKF